MTFVTPGLQVSFTCPACNAFSRQTWFRALGQPIVPPATDDYEPQYVGGSAQGGFVQGILFAQCDHCRSISIWRRAKLIWPREYPAPLPNPDLPDLVKRDFLEARAVVSQSPRAAAALLRLAVQRLMPTLGQKGSNLNDDIAALVRDGLPVRVQQALDALRVTGNNAVHPGVMDAADDREAALQLFGLLNFIADRLLTQGKVLDGIYGALPEAARDAIAKRDSGA